jgi:hypothetical protein
MSDQRMLLGTAAAAVVCLSPDGRDKWEMHIKVPNELDSLVPPPVGDDVIALQNVAQPGTIDKQ